MTLFFLALISGVKTVCSFEQNIESNNPCDIKEPVMKIAVSSEGPGLDSQVDPRLAENILYRN